MSKLVAAVSQRHFSVTLENENIPYFSKNLNSPVNFLSHTVDA
jgi:hypothetical protein